MRNRSDIGQLPRERSARRDGSTRELRERIATEAARLMTESGLRDYAFAKRKAAARLGVHDDSVLPKNSEIEDALRLHQRLFQSEEHPQLLRQLRETALEAMRFLAEFEPRLVGAVFDGSADRHSAVCLHLFSDDPDAPARFLADRGIHYETQDRRLRMTRDEYKEFPALVFSADATTIDLTVFPQDDLRRAPLDRVNEAPMHRAAVAELARLLADESAIES